MNEFELVQQHIDNAISLRKKRKGIVEKVVREMTRTGSPQLRQAGERWLAASKSQRKQPLFATGLKLAAACKAVVERETKS